MQVFKGKTMKKILVVNGHTRNQTYVGALAGRYVEEATKSGAEVQVLNLRDVPLEAFLKFSHAGTNDDVYPAEIAVLHQQLLWADHIVLIYPIWWGLPTGLMKTYIEVAFAPKVAFKYLPPKNGIVRWEKLLTGKTARVIATIDSPPWYYIWVRGDANGRGLKRSILGFCGITKVAVNYFGSIKTSTLQQRNKWLDQVGAFGTRDAS